MGLGIVLGLWAVLFSVDGLMRVRHVVRGGWK